MQTRTALFVTILVFVSGLWLYFTVDQDEPQPAAEANVASVVEEEEPAPEKQEPERVNVDSTEGINEELDSILEGYAAIESEFNTLEGQRTATTSQE